MWLFFLVLAFILLLAEASHSPEHIQLNAYHEEVDSDSTTMRWVRVRNRGTTNLRRPVTTIDSSLTVLNHGNQILMTSQKLCEDRPLPADSRHTCRDFEYNPQACEVWDHSERCCICANKQTWLESGEKSAPETWEKKQGSFNNTNLSQTKRHSLPEGLYWQIKQGTNALLDHKEFEFNAWRPLATMTDSARLTPLQMNPGQKMATVADTYFRGWASNRTFSYGNSPPSTYSIENDRRLIDVHIPDNLNQTVMQLHFQWEAKTSIVHDDYPPKRIDFAMSAGVGDKKPSAFVHGGAVSPQVEGNWTLLGDFWSMTLEPSVFWDRLSSCPSASDLAGEPCNRSGHTLVTVREPTATTGFEMADASPYLFGGNLTTQDTDEKFSNQLWVYFQRNDSWVRRHYQGDMPAKRAHHTAVVTSTGKLRFYGGIHVETGCFRNPRQDGIRLCGHAEHMVSNSLQFCYGYGFSKTTRVAGGTARAARTCYAFNDALNDWTPVYNSVDVLQEVCCSYSKNQFLSDIFDYDIETNTMVQLKPTAHTWKAPRFLSNDPGARGYHHAMAIPNGMLVFGGLTNEPQEDTMDQMFVLLDGWALSDVHVYIDPKRPSYFTLQPRLRPKADVRVTIVEKPLPNTIPPILSVSTPDGMPIVWKAGEFHPVNISVELVELLFGVYDTYLVFDTSSEDEEFNGGALNMVELIVTGTDVEMGRISVIEPGTVDKSGSYSRCGSTHALSTEPPVSGRCVPCVGHLCPNCGAGMRFTYWKSFPLCQECAPGRFRSNHHVQWQSFIEHCAPCPAGTYMPNSGSTFCQTCEDEKKNTQNVVCAAAEDGSRPAIAAAEHWWKFNDYHFAECMHKGDRYGDRYSPCLGNNACERGYTGPLCGDCSPGWAKGSIGFDCDECPGEEWVAVVLLIIWETCRVAYIFWAMMKAMAAAFSLRHVKDVVLRQIINYFVLMGRIHFQSHFPQTTVDEGREVLRFSSAGKFSFVTMQCGYRAFADLPPSRNFAIVGWIHPCIAILMALVYAFLGRKMRWLSLSGAAMDDFSVMLVVFMYTIYANTTTYLLESIAVYKAEHLALNSTVKIWQSDQAFWTMLSAVGILLWVVLLPVALLVATICHKRKFGLSDRRTRVRVGWLINGYEARYYYWEAVILLRQLSIIALDTLTVELPSSHRAFCLLIAGLLFLVLHLVRKPYDNRFNEELDILEHKMLSCFVGTNALDLLLRACDEDIRESTFRWIALVIVIYGNATFWIHCLLMLSSGVVPASCAEYFFDRWKAILESNTFGFVTHKGRIELEGLTTMERRYLSIVLRELDYTFCGRPTTAKHLRIGGARHDVVCDAVRRFYRRTHVPGPDEIDHIDVDKTHFAHHDSPDPADHSVDTGSTPMTSIEKHVSDNSEVNVEAVYMRSMHYLAFKRASLEVPNHVTLTVDDLHLEIIKSCKSERFLQELHRIDSNLQDGLKRPLPLAEKQKGPVEMTIKELASNSMSMRAAKSGRSSPSGLAEDRGLSLHEGHIGFAASHMQETEVPRTIEEKANIRLNRLGFQWLDQTCYGHGPPLLSTYAEDEELEWRLEMQEEARAEAEEGDQRAGVFDQLAIQVKMHQEELSYAQGDEEAMARMESRFLNKTITSAVGVNV